MVTHACFKFCAGDPEALADISNRAPSERGFNSANGSKTSPALSNWKNIPSLILLNIYYDMTPAKYITMIACENNLIPPSLVNVILHPSD